MTDAIQRSDSIESSGFPLGFKVSQGASRPGVIGDAASKDLFRVELRAMGGHQKEAVVTEGERGSAYRAVSDEGPGLRGTDLAPNILRLRQIGGHEVHRVRRRIRHDDPHRTVREIPGADAPCTERQHADQ